MTAKDIAGLIYSNGYDDCIPELTALRTMGSVPFGGRYRLIDFTLSEMVNFGITKVGILTKNNYRSLMDHVGSGRPWDLSRKTGGIFLLPPFNTSEAGNLDSRLASYIGAEEFLSLSKEEYVIISDCNVVCNIDMGKLVEFHEAKNADITIAYTNGKLPNVNGLGVFSFDEDNRITGMEISPKVNSDCAYSANIVFAKKSLLLSLIANAKSRSYTDFNRDIILRNIDSLKIYGYRIQGFCRFIDSLQSYYDINMELLKYENRTELFCDDRPVYTKVRDDMPTVYGIESEVKNSLIADGCIINGVVENSVISRGVRVEKGAVVKNCVLMQGTYIGEDTSVNCIISDKDVVIKPRKSLSGAENYPVYLSKKTVI